MYRKLLKNDLKNDPLQSFNIAFFILLSVVFLAAAGQLTIRLTSSIEHLFETAKTPHLMQMHTGQIDRERMKSFVEAHPEIEDHQILHFLNVDNALLELGENSLKDSVYDNGFSVQSPRFDYLLDREGRIIEAKKGEVYVPILYEAEGLVNTGDWMRIGDHRLRVAGFVRDSQMNSSLSVSRRFIINEEDYRQIEDLGTVEYLIEFRLQDLASSSKIEAAYSEANLEAEGPPLLTYALFRIVSAFSDGISIAALLLISLLVIGISLLCIRFTLLAKLEEDRREMAVLKAIGIPFAQRKKLFLGKYLFIAALSTISGFFFSFVFKIPFLQNMKALFGEGGGGIWEYLAAALLSLLVFGVIWHSMDRIGRKLRDLPLDPARAEGEEFKAGRSLFGLPRELQLALSDLAARKKAYLTMIFVFVLSVFVLTVPMSLYFTISDVHFINYLGIGSYDLRIDLSQMQGKEEQIREMIQRLRRDPAVEKMEVFKSRLLDYKSEGGSLQKIWVDFGDHESFPIRYIEGRAPQGEDEIALSALKAAELSKKTEDSLKLLVEGREKTLRISGIFSDLTNGGKTAKANFEIAEEEVIWMILPIKLRENMDPRVFMEGLRQDYPFAKLSDMQTYMDQIFGDSIRMTKKISFTAFGASIFLVFLITALFVRMLYFKDRAQNALLKAIGLTEAQIKRQYFIRFGLILLLGLLAGNLLVISLGDALAGRILSLMGVFGIRFLRNPIFSYLFVPLAMLVSTLLAVSLSVGGSAEENIARLLKEDV